MWSTSEIRGEKVSLVQRGEVELNIPGTESTRAFLGERCRLQLPHMTQGVNNVGDAGAEGFGVEE